MKNPKVKCTGSDDPKCWPGCNHNVEHDRESNPGDGNIYCTEWGFCGSIGKNVRCVRVKPLEG